MSMANASYPIPVLGNGEGADRDVASEWRVGNVVSESGTEYITIRFRVFTDDPDLARLIKEGSARIMARWQCSSTISTGYLDLMEKVRHADGLTYEATLDQRTVAGDILVDVFAAAVRPDPAFRWTRQHEDYGDGTFDVRVGDLLTTVQRFRVSTVKLYDPQNPPLDSIFHIVADSSTPNMKGIRTDYSDTDQIIVKMSPTLLAHVQLMGSETLKLSTLVLPALVDAISFMRACDNDPDNTDDLSDREWHRTLTRLITANGLEHEDSPLAIAQRLLADPIGRYADETARANDTEEES